MTRRPGDAWIPGISDVAIGIAGELVPPGRPADIGPGALSGLRGGLAGSLVDVDELDDDESDGVERNPPSCSTTDRAKYSCRHPSARRTPPRDGDSRRARLNAPTRPTSWRAGGARARLERIVGDQYGLRHG
ncbi:MAG TPA: hypothetical protein VFK56_17660 [Mycobacterium sp.]|nr:hypothetical protein [Mycobacterium sp.]